MVFKLVSCPFQILIGKSSIRSALFGALIAFYYQFILTKKNYAGYLLGNRRESLLDANKEGIYSCIGYVAIFLISQAIFLRLSEILRKR